MAVSKQTNLVIRQGDTFTRVIRWEVSPLIYKAISAIGQVAPMLITAATHGLTNGWKVAVRDVVGMLDANAKNNPPTDNEFRPCTVVDANTVSINTLSAAGFDAYVSGGYLVFYTPQDLTGYSARMKIKDRIGGTVLETLTTQAGTGFVVDSTAKTITLTILAVDTTLLTFTRAVYDLEMVSASGIVTAILSGNVVLTKEVTT